MPTTLPMKDLVVFLTLKTNSNLNSNSINCRCPFCNDNKYHLNINMTAGVYRCVRCNTSGGMLDLYSRVIKGAPASSFNSKELFIEMKKALYGEGTVRKTAPSPQGMNTNTEIPCAPDYKLDKAYRALLSFPPFYLSNFHKNKLLRRGLAENDIIRNGYRSLPSRSEWVKKSKFYPSLLNDRELLKLAKKTEELSKLSTLQLFACIIAGEFVAKNCDIHGVPGFFMLGKYHCFNVKDIPGILIPTRNERGEIVSMQLRTDNFRIRYMTISSKNLGGPNKGISRIHYPVNNDNITSGAKIFLTEGPLKADVALSIAKRLAPKEKIVFAAMQGINNTGQEKSFFKLIHAAAPGEKVYLTFDMDKLSNPFVLNGCKTAFSMAAKYHVPLVNYCWDPISATEKCAEYYRFGRKHNIAGVYPATGTKNDYNICIHNTEVLFRAHEMTFERSMWSWKNETKGIDDYLLFVFNKKAGR